MLQDNSTEVNLEEHPEYQLTAKFEKTGNNTIKISPSYAIIYHKLLSGEESTIVQPITAVKSFEDVLIKPYFTENDVYTYILNQLGDDFIKVNAEKFASGFYALAQATQASPKDLLDEEKIQKYQALYNKQDGHIKIENLDAGICVKNNSRMTYDDFEGTLTLSYCVTTKDNLENGNYPNAKEITKTGFKKLTAEYIKNNYSFNVAMNSVTNPAKNKEDWLKTIVQPNTVLFRIDQKDTIPELFKSKPFKLSLNGSETISDCIGAGQNGASKGNDGNELIIQNITLSKEIQKEVLQITFSIDTSHEPIVIDITPFYGHEH